MENFGGAREASLEVQLIIPRSFADRHFPALLKSLRSQRVIYVSCGEDHTAALTKLSVDLCSCETFICDLCVIKILFFSKRCVNAV